MMRAVEIMKKVKKVMEEIEREEGIWWGKVEVEIGEAKEVAKKRGYYYSWEGVAGIIIEKLQYWVVYEDGVQEVPYARYVEEHAEGWRREEERDIWVGDFINSKTIAVIERERELNDVEGRDYVDNVYTKIILFESNKEEILSEVIKKIKEAPLEKLLEIFVRLD